MPVIVFPKMPFIWPLILNIFVDTLEERNKHLQKTLYTGDCRVLICHLHCNEILQNFRYLNMEFLNKLLDVSCCYKNFVQNGNCLNFLRNSLESPINQTS